MCGCVTKNNFAGKTAYPRDIATKKHVDRIQDRLDRRIDLHGDKVERLKAVQIALESELRDLKTDSVILRGLIYELQEGKKQS